MLSRIKFRRERCNGENDSYMKHWEAKWSGRGESTKCVVYKRVWRWESAYKVCIWWKRTSWAVFWKISSTFSGLLRIQMQWENFSEKKIFKILKKLKNNWRFSIGEVYRLPSKANQILCTFSYEAFQVFMRSKVHSHEKCLDSCKIGTEALKEADRTCWCLNDAVI